MRDYTHATRLDVGENSDSLDAPQGKTRKSLKNAKTLLKRLDDHQDHDGDHQHGRDLVDHTPIARRPPRPVRAKHTNGAAEMHVNTGHQHDERDLGMQPAALKTEANRSERSRVGKECDSTCRYGGS